MAASDLRPSTARTSLLERDRFMMPSSSPSLPDIHELAPKQPKAPTILRSGSAAAPIPANAINTFTSAAVLLRTARANGDDSFDTIDDPDPLVAKKPATKRSRKPAKVKDTENESGASLANTKTSTKVKVARRVAKEVIVLSSDGVTPEAARHDDPTGQKTERPESALPHEITAETEGTPLKAKPWKKYNPPIEQAQVESREEGSDPAKPVPKTRGRKKKSETVSRHFPTKEVPVVKKPAVPEKPGSKDKRPRMSTPEPINLDPAVHRRTDWTPPPQDTLASELEPFASSLDVSTPAEAIKDTNPTGIFKKLHDTYGCKVTKPEASPGSKPKSGKVLGKRKVIEMVAVNQFSTKDDKPAGPSPVKEKAIKKKPRTITELAVAAYAQPNASVTDDEARREDTSLLEFFNREASDQVASAENATVAKGKGKTSKVTKSKKKAQPKKPSLLSPRTAIKQSAAQDFVFGTSSQLAREQSPTLLRELHEALKASTIQEEDECSITPIVENRLSAKSTAKGLWSVSARDEEGELVSVDVIDLLDSSVAFPEDDAILDPRQQLPPPEPEAAENEPAANSSLIELGSRPAPSNNDKFSELALQKSNHLVAQRKITINSAAAVPPECLDSSFPSINDLIEFEMPPPSNQQQDQEEVSAPLSKAATAATAPKTRPKYELFTDAKLAKEISKYGFKPVKSRTGMISLLSQCWNSRIQAVSAGGRTFSSSVLAASPKRARSDSPRTASTTASPAKKPRGRPKKAATTETGEASAAAPVPKKRGRKPKEDAAQSVPPPPHPEPGPSTPKRKKAAAKTNSKSDSDLNSEAEQSSPEQLFSPETGNLSITEDTEVSLNLDPTAQQSELFTHITKAVTSAPRTTDPENPSWHEKMLMYDPIIIEDLTVWLNSGQLTRVGYDGEVSLLEVKKWCESRSICCLWEKNFRGKERKRF